MILSPEDFKKIKDIFYSVEKDEIPTKITHAIIEKKNFPELESILSKYYDLSDHYLKWTFRLQSNIPCKIHGDYGFYSDDINPSLVMIIPFQSDSHTIVFEQECLTTFDDYKLNHLPLEKNNIDPVKDNLTHIDNYDLSFVSIKSKEKWEAGKIIAFDRKLLHCSDNFKSSDVDKKIAAVLWFCYR